MWLPSKYCIDLEAYNQLPHPRPSLLQGLYEPPSTPPPPHVLFPFPSHRESDFSSELRAQITSSTSEQCSASHVFWTEGKSSDEVLAVTGPDMRDYKRMKLVDKFSFDIKLEERWDKLTEDIMVASLSQFACSLLRQQIRQLRTPEEWWALALEQVVVAKKHMRDSDPPMPKELVRFRTILDPDNHASLAYIMALANLRSCYVRSDLFIPSLKETLDEAKEYYEIHAETLAALSKQARKRLNQGRTNAAYEATSQFGLGDIGPRISRQTTMSGETRHELAGNESAGRVIRLPTTQAIGPATVEARMPASGSNMTMTSSTSVEAIVTPPPAVRFTEALVLADGGEGLVTETVLESHRRMSRIAEDEKDGDLDPQ